VIPSAAPVDRQGLVDRIDWTAGYADLIKGFDQTRTVCLAPDALDDLIQPVAVRDACLRRRIIGTLDEIVPSNILTEPAPDRRPRRDVETAVAGLAYAVGAPVGWLLPTYCAIPPVIR
jgi:hypothetical protein